MRFLVILTIITVIAFDAAIMVRAIAEKIVPYYFTQ